MGKKGTSKHNAVRKRTTSNRDHDSPLKSYKYDYSKDYSDPSWPYSQGKLDRSAKILLVVFPTLIISSIVYVYYMASLREMVRTPLAAPKIISPNATSVEVDPDRFWGTYRSGLYFGMKTRTPTSPVAGMMWLTQLTGEVPPPIRHWCEQGDELPMYSWFIHDGVTFGIQELLDKYIIVSTDFLKRPGGQHGGDWTARVHVRPRTGLQGTEKAVVSVFFYMALDGQGSLQPEVRNGNQVIMIRGSSQELGNFSTIFPQRKDAEQKFNYLVTYADSLDQLKDKVMQGFSVQEFRKNPKMQYLGLTGTNMPEGVPKSKANFIVHQVTFSLPYDMEVWFESGSFDAERQGHLSAATYQEESNAKIGEFDKKFEATFKLEAKGFDKDHIGFAKALLSNMIGGVGYFYGSSLVKSKYTGDEPLEYWKAPLYTGVPSRSFFPRGFLWDEGFHNMLISKWDQKMSMEIIGHWLDLMNAEGWIPREQILGKEARAKVPEQFVVQHIENANPPTFFLPLQRIVKNLIVSDDPKDREYLERLYPRLKTWYSWYMTTQAGSRPFTYRWRGRDPTARKQLNPLTLTSGLDDFPRASHPTEEERHVDLRCWMALASGVMADIARTLNESNKEYEEIHKKLTDNKLLDELHWSEKAQRYSDYGLHTDQVKLERPKPKPPAPGQRPPPPKDKERAVKKEPVYGFVDTTFGYVNLFPFLLKIVEPDSLKLGKILADLQDPNLLWTKYGLRSLAKNSPLYMKHNTEHDPPYWRGAIWINMNYLALGALHHYSSTPGPYQDKAQELYKELRDNIIANLYKQYQQTGYIWENYNDASGEGKGSHPFTGWSALVVSIMAEDY